MLNTPNILSIFRLCLVPAFVVVYFSGHVYSKIFAVCIYALATFTDFLDGYLARRFNLITNLGKVLDPLGDKMFTFAVLCCMTIDGIIPLFILLIFFAKEILMGLGGLILHRVAKSDIPPSNIIGKTATVIFFIVCVLIMIFDDMPRQLAWGLIGLALLISCAALASYAVGYFRIMKSRKSS